MQEELTREGVKQEVVFGPEDLDGNRGRSTGRSLGKYVEGHCVGTSPQRFL